MYRDYYTPPRETIINMEQFRKDYNKVKNMTKTTHERYILEIFRGYIIENAVQSEYNKIQTNTRKKDNHEKDTYTIQKNI